METKKRNIACVELMAKCALRIRKPVKAHGAFQLFSKHSRDSMSSFNKVRYGTLRRTVISFTSISKCSHTVRSMVTPRLFCLLIAKNFSSYVNILLFPDSGQIRAGFSDGLPAPGVFEKEK